MGTLSHHQHGQQMGISPQMLMLTPGGWKGQDDKEVWVRILARPFMLGVRDQIPPPLRAFRMSFTVKFGSFVLRIQ